MLSVEESDQPGKETLAFYVNVKHRHVTIV